MTVQRRSTKQRSAVSAVLDEADAFLSAQDLHARLRDRGEAVGLATVYRALQALAEDGDVDVLRTDDGEAVYRRCSTGHHHHLVCRRCGRTVEVEGPTVESWARRIGAEHGFTEVEHVVEVFGVCASCSAQGVADQATRP
ncbi:Fur family transcriptional regulator [Kineococcus gynurae]|uniref:Fur family transcriptional regulator n=1 Tax=Kineococcus gynurae TaxID=452979 RepID=A0ABV5LQA2_9ACTN